ncbi:MAG TPA: prolyl oligopeptidase family serine peptidase, partial [Gemmatimonadales bacterium]|nr:prolyl oligopeptidase family serine peptidase [Gemmatimonadales bacterium]
MGAGAPPPPPPPPVAPRRPHPITLHGERLEDDYYWLRDKSDPAVLAYLAAENAHAEALLAPVRGLEESLYQEMLGRIKQTDLSVPYREGAAWYYSRTEEGKQYPIHCRKRGSLEAPEEILLDLNLLAAGHSFMALGVLEVSDDGRLMAYSTDHTGFREFTLLVRDLDTGATVLGPLDKCGSVAWAADNRTLLFTVEDDAKRFHRVWRTAVTGPERDAPVLVYEEPDQRFRVAVERTRSRRHLLIASDSHTTSELRVLPADRPESPWRLLVPRVAEREVEADHLGDGWLLRLNDTGPNFRVVRAAEDDPAAAWEELLPHRDDVMIEGIDAFAGHWVAWERAAGLVGIRVTHRKSGAARHVTFPEPVYEAYPGPNAEWDTGALRYGYESPVTPGSVYDYDLATGESTLLKRREVLGGFDPSRYGCARLSVPAPDGAAIPVSLVFRHEPAPPEPVPPEPAPMLLTGYGAYGIPYPVGFSSNRLSLLDRGVVLAFAHVRGGGELGKRWHDAGRMAFKMHSFTDFIAVAEALIEERRTAPALLAIEGGSAGGLLMGAVTNFRPDLFAAVVAQVPFVDVINT